MADKNVHRPKRPISLPEIEIDVGQRARVRRFSISRQIHGIAIKTSGGERLAETKEHFFRAAVTMGEERNGMWAGRCGENSKCGCICSQHYFFDADTRLDHARKYDPKNQDGDRRYS